MRSTSIITALACGACVLALSGLAKSVPLQECDLNVRLEQVEVWGRTIDTPPRPMPVDTLYLPLTVWRDTFWIRVSIKNAGKVPVTLTRVYTGVDVLVGQVLYAEEAGITLPDEDASIQRSVLVPSPFRGEVAVRDLHPGQDTTVVVGPFALATVVPWLNARATWHALTLGIEPYAAVMVFQDRPKNACFDDPQDNTGRRRIRIVNIY